MGCRPSSSSPPFLSQQPQHSDQHSIHFSFLWTSSPRRHLIRLSPTTMKTTWLASGIAATLAILPIAASPVNRARASLFVAEDGQYGELNELRALERKRDSHLSALLMGSQTGIVTEEVTVTTTTTITGVPSLSTSGLASASASLSSSSIVTPSGTSTGTSTAASTDGSCSMLTPFPLLLSLVLVPLLKQDRQAANHRLQFGPGPGIVGHC